MNVVNGREFSQYGIQTWKNYDLALKMLKCYKQDEFKTLGQSLERVGEHPVFACRSCRLPNYKHLLALADEDGKIGIQDITSTQKNTSSKIHCTQGHMNAIFDLSWSDCSLRLSSVSGDHTAVLWDISDQAITPLAMFEGHTRSVKVASFRPQSPNVFATGARDGMVVIWDYRCSQQASTPSLKPDNIILNAHCQSGGSSVKKTKRTSQSSRAESITGLTFQDENFLISCSAGDGVIKVWDIRKCYSTYQRKLPQACYSLPHPGGSAKNGFTSLSVDSGGVRLFANCMDNNIYCYNIATYEKTPVATYLGHQNSTFYVKSCLSSDGQYLLSGSTDERAYIWRVEQPGLPVVRLVGHTAEVTCVDWADCNNSDVKVVTCADDSTHRLWSLCPPTDDTTTLKPDMVGWTEWVEQPSSVSVSTPCSGKRLARKQDFTPIRSDLKRVKALTGEDCDSQERSVLATMQLRTEGKGARRLFDCDHSAQCSGVALLSPTSNLPNYVVEGTSQFHRCSSSASKQKENWLAKLQTTPSPKQTAKKITPKRSQSNVVKTPKACGNLLKFFKIAGKQNPLNASSCEVQRESSLSKLSSSVKT